MNKKSRTKKNSAFGDKATRLVSSVLAGSLASKGMAFVKDMPFMASPDKFNIKKAGADAGLVAIGSGLALMVDHPIAEGAGIGLATIGGNGLSDEALIAVVPDGMAGKKKAMGNTVDDFLNMYRKKPMGGPGSANAQPQLGDAVVAPIQIA